MNACVGLFGRIVVIMLLSGAIVACGGKEERKAKYLERGKNYLESKNYDKAKIEFKNVLQIDPKDADAHMQLGKVEEKRQNFPKAFSAYEKAAELRPDWIEPKARMAQFYLAQASVLKARSDEKHAANVLALAQEHIERIQALDPVDPPAPTL